MSDTLRPEVAEDLTMILGGGVAPARLLAARLLASGAGRVVLIDQEDPTTALLNERAPTPGTDVRPLDHLAWRAMVDSGRLSGAAMGPDPIAWLLGSFGLLRPTRIIVLGALRDGSGGTLFRSRLLKLSDELAANMAAVGEYVRLLRSGHEPTPRVLVAVAGLAGAPNAAAASKIVEGLVEEQLGESAEAGTLVLLPRLLGAGPVADADFHRILRRLLFGEPVRAEYTPAVIPQWLDQASAADLLIRVLQDPISEVRRSAAGDHGVPVVRMSGHEATLGYVATVIADEVDRLLADPLLRRSTLLDPLLVYQASEGASSALAEAIRLAVRWHAANASMISRALV